MAETSPSSRLFNHPHRPSRCSRPQIRRPILKRPLLGKLGIDLGSGRWRECQPPDAGRGWRGVACRGGVHSSSTINRTDFISRPIEIRPVLLEVPALGIEPEDIPVGLAAIEGARHGQACPSEGIALVCPEALKSGPAARK